MSWVAVSTHFSASGPVEWQLIGGLDPPSPRPSVLDEPHQRSSENGENIHTYPPSGGGSHVTGELLLFAEPHDLQELGLGETFP